MTIDNFETIKAYVLTLGSFEDSAKLDLQIEMIIDEVLAYCYRKDVPSCMELPLADVIVGQINKLDALSGLDGDITSYREGDMSVNFGNSTSNNTTVRYNGKLEGFKQIIGAIKCSETTDAQ
jgi:hypothetical protein